ncbi:MAG: 50S ribosomal protein L14 [Thermoproteota archaeon]|nr:MAG: 50S ribosomal protein L14 [Candidatus Korarchaeota archaeon]RLG55195.1 MAG: 50S ribosomal protein L14 [Candidatus Korarchaeota archaeon]
MSRSVRKKGAMKIRLRVTRGLPVGAYVKCADNSGAKLLQIIGVTGYKGTKNRLASAAVGDLVIVAVKEGTPELEHTVQKAIIIRQKMPFKRKTGETIAFEDNAAILVHGDLKPRGTEVKGPVAREAVERFPSIAGICSMVV